MLTEAQREATLARFADHRAAWDKNPALRALYAGWYGAIREALPPPALGPRVELGSGPGFARHFIPDLMLTDVVRAPWHDAEVSGDALPFDDDSTGALVLFDVLHHLPSPRRFLNEASRVLRTGGRVVLCEPFMSALSFPVYKLFHEEPVDFSVNPLATEAASDKNPFDANQAIPTVLFGRDRDAFTRAFPALAVEDVRYLAGPSYVLSGGFGRSALLPFRLWRALHSVEARWPSFLFRWLGFRMLVVLEKRSR
jgi:SAM-dependent methyltransferase